MRTSGLLGAAVAALLVSCSGGTTPEAAGFPQTPIADTGVVWQRVELRGLDDNVKHDTLLIQTTFDLGDGRFVMVASNVEESRDGLRLYLYQPQADSSARVLASSKPGYDSSTMLPTFFQCADTSQGWVILANMGERESWGQEAFWLKDGRFISLGWLNVAQRDWKTVDDSLQQWRTNIAPRATVHGGNGAFLIGFSGDSLQLYDDLQGHLEVTLPSNRLRYRCTEGQAELLIDGVPVRAAI